MADNMDLKTTFPELNDNQFKQLKQLLDEAYRQGYNDNSRDCYCDSPGATEGVLPHHHLLDDGKSHAIRPDLKRLGL